MSQSNNYATGQRPMYLPSPVTQRSQCHLLSGSGEFTESTAHANFALYSVLFVLFKSCLPLKVKPTFLRVGKLAPTYLLFSPYLLET